MEKKQHQRTRVRRPRRAGGLTTERFLAMSPAQRAEVVAQIESKTPEKRLADSRPLNATERAQWARFQAKVKRRTGRPKIGKGSAVISLSVERDLLARADRYAKAHGLGRSELFAACVREMLEGAA